MSCHMVSTINIEEGLVLSSLYVCYFLVCGFVTIVKAIFGTIIMVINFQRISIIAVIWG